MRFGFPITHLALRASIIIDCYLSPPPMTNPATLRDKIENIITIRLNGMPNHEEYMINTTMKVLVINDLVDLLADQQRAMVEKVEAMKEAVGDIAYSNDDVPKIARNKALSDVLSAIKE